MSSLLMLLFRRLLAAIPTNAYVAEDGVTPYVAENGVTYYTKES